jgi:carbon-monoxide dehydrogenase small subunit
MSSEVTNMSDVELRINGDSHSVATDPCRTLLAVLRDDLGLTGAKEGCGKGDCGSCVVVMDGLAVNSCLVLAGQAEGAEITTIEGLASGDELHPLQREFIERWAFQCGFCTPGMLMTAYAFLTENPEPEPAEVRRAIAGNLCRCTNYRNVIEAVVAASTEGGAT